MGLAVGAPVGNRGRGGNVSSELLERKTIEKVNLPVHIYAFDLHILIQNLAFKYVNCKYDILPNQPVCLLN